MCKAKHYAEQLLDIYNSIENDLDTYNKERTDLEGLELDVLHILENENFNVVQGYKLAKMIKDARIRRRDVKNEIDPLVNLKKNFVEKNIKELKSTLSSIQNQDRILTELKEKKIYKPRTLKTTDLKLVVSQ
jgi:AAA+ ATPase superfamily predicted ATPase